MRYFLAKSMSESRLKLPEEQYAARRAPGLRIRERPTFLWLALNKTSENSGNKRPPTTNGSVEGVMGLSWQDVFLKITAISLITLPRDEMG